MAPINNNFPSNNVVVPNTSQMQMHMTQPSYTNMEGTYKNQYQPL